MCTLPLIAYINNLEDSLLELHVWRNHVLYEPTLLKKGRLEAVNQDIFRLNVDIREARDQLELIDALMTDSRSSVRWTPSRSATTTGSRMVGSGSSS